MANHSSAKKRIRQNIKRNLINKMNMSKIRTSVKKVENLIEENKKEESKIAFKEAESNLMKGVGKGLIKKNTSSRKVSRLSQAIKKMAA